MQFHSFARSRSTRTTIERIPRDRRFMMVVGAQYSQALEPAHAFHREIECEAQEGPRCLESFNR